MSNVQKVIEELTPVFNGTEEVLLGLPQEGCTRLEVLTGMVAVRLNWNEQQVRENTPIVRAYIQKHPEYYITRGAHGGVARTSRRDEKLAAQAAKDAAKAQLKASVEQKLATTETNPETDQETDDLE